MRFIPLLIIAALLSSCANVTPNEKRQMLRGICQLLSEPPPEPKHLKDILFPLPQDE